MYRRSAQLALPALFFLAWEGVWRPHRVRGIAAQLGVQAPYLSKIFQQLQCVGLVRTVRGARGGVRLLSAFRLYLCEHMRPNHGSPYEAAGGSWL
ncbi:MAG: Rrf2 family transcriptional regulator [Terriglobia bacterium]